MHLERTLKFMHCLWIPFSNRCNRSKFLFGILSGGAIAFRALIAVSQPIEEPVPADTVYHDFDGDGVREKLISRPGQSSIRHWISEKKEWIDADFKLPEDVSLVDANGKDAGLRFVDLNGDGLDDVLFSNSERVSVYLWNKDVKPQLGWTRGWSQFVRSGARTGAANEPPSVVGCSLRIEGDTLWITPTNSSSVTKTPTRLSMKRMIAFDMPPPKSPEEALACFRVREGFQVELVASEPVVIDPVALDWDSDGRLWVVEMRDYPLGMDGHGKPGGVVKVLDDVDAAGRYHRAVPFMESIPFPSSAMPWRNGALIASAPDLIYAEDTDGDGRADKQTVLFTGFNPGNQQHRFNGFEWGLDGWIYAANGDSGGTIQSLKTGKTLSISGRDFRFRPETGEMETVSAQTQFGRRRDDWGNWFGNNNPNWLWHVVLPEHYLRRNPQLAVPRVLHMLANYENSTRVFPVSAAMVRPNQPWSIGHVTSGCSPCAYRDDWFGPDFATTVFASEPVHNVVHREVLERRGSGFVSHRAAGEEHSEFLASTDNWFRPTTTKVGPDGALYIADMYRFVLEHPEWISPEMQQRLDLRAGSDKGRIYRVIPKGKPRRPLPHLAHASTAELVKAMETPNGWQRDMAQRLLVNSPDPASHPLLRALLTLSHPPQVRIQALSTLALLHALTAQDLQPLLDDPHPGVRSEALRQSEPFATQSPGLLESVRRAAADSDGLVRLQAAFTLGAWPPQQIESILAELLSREDTDEMIRLAALSSLRPDSALFAQEKTKKTRSTNPAPSIPAVTPSSADRAAVIAQYKSVEGLSGNATRGHQQFQALCLPCHRLRGEGNEVGPDLGMVGSKPTDWLVTAILDPNQAVEARYRAWKIGLKSGDAIEGIISAETANNLVLRVAGGLDQPVLRQDIAAIQPSTQSLMPTGFESALKPQDLADLIQWLRGP